MFDVAARIIKGTLKPSFRRDEEKTRLEYNAMGSVLFAGVGCVAFASLLSLPDFHYKLLVYAYSSYCIFLFLYTKVRPPGYRLTLSVLQIPLGLAMILSLQAVMPLDMVYLTGFLYPIVFVFLYEFHTRFYSRLIFALTLLTTGSIVVLRGLPYWEAYLFTSFGATLIVGRVVSDAASKLQAQANQDALTGLMNRRHWEERLLYLMSLAERDGSIISVAYFDIDYFKRINDRLGHAHGDALLQCVAKCLRKVCREADLVGRWGGDEFAIAMPNTDKRQATQLIERLQSELKEVSFSAGVVSMRSGESLENMLRRADQAMYEVKSRRDTLIDQPA